MTYTEIKQEVGNLSFKPPKRNPDISTNTEELNVKILISSNGIVVKINRSMQYCFDAHNKIKVLKFAAKATSG